MNDTTAENTKLSWWRRLSNGLKRTSNSLGTAVADLVTKRKLDRAMLEDIEDVLLRADLGAEVAARISAAVCPTFCLSMPVMVMWPLLGSTVISIPCGMAKRTGCEYPSWKTTSFPLTSAR